MKLLHIYNSQTEEIYDINVENSINYIDGLTNGANQSDGATLINEKDIHAKSVLKIYG